MTSTGERIRYRSPVRQVGQKELEQAKSVLFYFFLVIIAFWVLDARSQNPVNVEPGSAAREFVLDREAELPSVYTGELVDLDGDGVAEVALFGSAEAPEVFDMRGADRWPTMIQAGTALLVPIIGLLGREGFRWLARRKGEEASPGG